MVDQHEGNGAADLEQRMVTVAYPRTFAEFREFFDQGYQVAATPEQRIAWGLQPVDDVPVLSQEQALRVLFAEPGDPILDELDEECYPDSNWDAAVAKAPDEVAMQGIVERERRLDTAITVREMRRSSLPSGGGGSASEGEIPEAAAASA